MEQKSKNSQRKQLGKQLTNLIETNDIKKIDELLSVETNIKILRENRFICPYIISIKTNNLHLFDYFTKKGFKLRGKVRKQSQSDNENQKPLTTSQSYSKALIEAEIESQKRDIISKLEKGQVLEGIVKNITTYGVFIDLGGVDGLIHITDLSWGRINHPEEIVKLDEKINVVIFS